MAPPATAATHVSARTGKTVSFGSRTPRIPDATCNARYASSRATDIKGAISYSRDNGCVGLVSGYLYNHKNTDWWMRVRSYTRSGLRYSRFNTAGVIEASKDRIFFLSGPHHGTITKVCEAMVRSSAPGTVRYGPVCENTGY